jgi:hypothetical protein
VAALLAVIGVASATVGFAGLSVAVARSIQPLREARLSTDAQRFLFDRRAWGAVATDDLFPPIYRTTAAAPELGAERVFTRLGVASPAACRAAFGPALARQVAAHPCGPVLRAGYADATSTLVITVGVAVLGTTPDEQTTFSATTGGPHADLWPHPVSFPGTAAAAFGDAQRLAFEVSSSSDAPFLSFAVVGFGDGRAASADPGQEVLDQSGALLTAIDLEGMVDGRMARAVDGLWAARR